MFRKLFFSLEFNNATLLILEKEWLIGDRFIFLISKEFLTKKIFTVYSMYSVNKPLEFEQLSINNITYVWRKVPQMASIH